MGTSARPQPAQGMKKAIINHITIFQAQSSLTIYRSLVLLKWLFTLGDKKIKHLNSAATGTVAADF